VADAAKGYDHIPTVSGTPKAVASDGGIEKEDIDWDIYTARDLKVKAPLPTAKRRLTPRNSLLRLMIRSLSRLMLRVTFTPRRESLIRR